METEFLSRYTDRLFKDAAFERRGVGKRRAKSSGSWWPAWPGRIFPDFSFADAAGDLVVWEHVGRMDDPQYIKGHEWKMQWYADYGYTKGTNLFTTKETLASGVDSSAFDAIIADIQQAV